MCLDFRTKFDCQTNLDFEVDAFVVLVVLVALLVIKDSVFLRINQNIFNDCVLYYL